jgi:antitoxin component YwqK of YwqJK toxin-antitoxin module
MKQIIYIISILIPLIGESQTENIYHHREIVGIPKILRIGNPKGFDTYELTMDEYNECSDIFIATVDTIIEENVKFKVLSNFKGIDKKYLVSKESPTQEFYTCYNEDQIIKLKDTVLVYLFDINNQKNIYCLRTKKFAQNDFDTNKYLQYEISLLSKLKTTQNGKWLNSYPNGHLESKGTLNNGLAIGEWEFFYPNGKLRAMGTYENGKRNGFWQEFDIIENYYCAYENALRAGVQFYLCFNIFEGNYTNSIMTGTWNVYYWDALSKKHLLYQTIYLDNSGKNTKQIDFK